MSYRRFIALGDSMTEGMSDQIIDGKYRGWADRTADVMATHWQDFSYANLAVRGKLVKQVLDEQIPVALNMVEGSSTLISFHAGANDVIRPKYDPLRTIATYNEGIEKLKRSGATLMLFCVLEDSGAKTRTAEIWKERFEVFNNNVRKKSAEANAILFDPNSDDFWRDPRFISEDRLHLNSEGHRRVAQAVLARFDLPHDPKWREKLPPLEKNSTLENVVINISWFYKYVIPWMGRRLRGRSSGDGRSPKYPEPITWSPRS